MRDHTAQQPPRGDADYEGFPSKRYRTGHGCFRAHSAGNGPWWFASDRNGRFNLLPPNGTCYVAEDAATALRERVGPELVRLGFVPESLLADAVVSHLRLPQPTNAADCESPRAVEFGVTREMATCTYALSQQWAAALHSAGFTGLRYGARFTPGDSGIAIALFGAGGGHDSARDPRPRAAADVAAEAGLQTIGLPRLNQLQLRRHPPRRRPGSGDNDLS